jgi:hypothetical protein
LAVDDVAETSKSSSSFINSALTLSKSVRSRRRRTRVISDAAAAAAAVKHLMQMMIQSTRHFEHLCAAAFMAGGSEQFRKHRVGCRL